MFSSIQDDLTNAYVITYRPEPSTDEGFRKITICIETILGRNCEFSHGPAITQEYCAM